MNSNGHLDPSASQAASGKSKKSKKKKNKSSPPKVNGDYSASNGKDTYQELDNAASDDDLDSPAADDSQQTTKSFITLVRTSSQTSLSSGELNGRLDPTSEPKATDVLSVAPVDNSHELGTDQSGEPATMLRDTDRRLETAAKERDQLRIEVTQLRKSLEGLQKRHDDEVSRLKTDFDQTKSNTQQRHTEEIADLQEKLETVKLETQGQHEVEIAQVHAQLTEVRSLAQRQHEQEVAQLKRQLEDTRTSLREQHDEEISSLKHSQQEAEIGLEQKHEEAVSSLKTQLEEDRFETKQRHHDEISKMRAHFEERETSTQQRHVQEISRLQDEHESMRTNSQQKLDEEMSTLEAQFDTMRISTETQHEQAMSTLRVQLADANQQHEQEIESLSKQLAEAKSTSNEQQEELALTKSQLLEAQTTAQQQLDDDTSELRTQVEELKAGKEHAESQYQKLLGKVNSIKAQLGERLKADAAELAQARTQIEELEERNRVINEETQSLQLQIAQLSAEAEQQAQDISNFRSRSNLSQQNWAKERDDLLTREAQIREEFESAKQAMQDWEVLAMEERSVREGLGERVGELEDQLSIQREAFERASSERDAQSATVDGLQRALREIQEARKVELREIVENTQTQLEEVRKQLKTAEESSTTSQKELDTAKQELERALPFEKEVKEKNLLIGKLRHEAVILNDHLTKALRFLKKGKTEDTVDRQLITNHVLQFLALDRADPKKFQVLQLISAILGWTEEQNEAAGLARPGASSQPINPNSSLRAPMSPFLRRVSSGAPTSSSVNLSSVFNSSPALASTPESAVDSPSGKESLAELWSSFLEREAASKDLGGSGSRRETLTSPTSGTSTPRQYGY